MPNETNIAISNTSLDFIRYYSLIIPYKVNQLLDMHFWDFK